MIGNTLRIHDSPLCKPHRVRSYAIPLPSNRVASWSGSGPALGASMECQIGDVACQGVEIIRHAWVQAQLFWAQAAYWLSQVFKVAQPHLQWIFGVFGVAMAAWRWYEKRDWIRRCGGCVAGSE